MTGTGIKAEGAFEEICRMESLAESFKNPSSGDGQSGTHVLPWWKKMISDTITREVGISDLVQYLPLGAAETWADALLERRPRQNVTEAIIKAGYDIRSAAQRLAMLYTRLDREACG